jgi:hypothetical protein
MRITATIEDKILADLMKFTRAKSKTAAINTALEDWVRHLKIDKLRSLRGKLKIEDNWRELRALEIHEPKAPYGRRSR